MSKKCLCAGALLLLLLTACGDAEQKPALWEKKDTFEQTLVTCMTEYWDLYRETHWKIANAAVEKADFDNASLEAAEPYYIYRIEDIVIRVKKVDADPTVWQDGRTEYQFYRGEEMLFTKQLYEIADESWVEEPKFYYLDMTGDGEKDILAIVPWMSTGTNPLAEMVLVYDVKENKEIPLFEDCLELTATQEEQLAKILDGNEAFSLLFPQYQYIFRVGYSAYVDEQGVLYFDFAIWRENGIDDCIGEIFAAFRYDIQEEKFVFDTDKIAFLLR